MSTPLDPFDPFAPGPVAPAGAPAVDPFDVAEEQQREQDADLLRAHAGAIVRNPSRAAEVLRLQAKTGVPYDAIDRNFDLVRQEAARADFDPEQFRRSNPKLAAWYRDPANAAVAQDDLANLSTLEWWVHQPWRMLKEGGRQIHYGWLGAKQLLGWDGEDDRRKIDELRPTLGLDYGTDTLPRQIVGETMRLLPQLATQLVLSKAGQALGEGTGALVGAVAGGSTPAPGDEAVAAPAGAAIGGRIGAFVLPAVFMASQEAGSFWLDSAQIKDPTGKPLDPRARRVGALVYGVGAGLLEQLSLEVFAGRIGPLKAWFSKQAALRAMAKPTVQQALLRLGARFGESYGTEVGTEVLQEGLAILMEDAAAQFSPGDWSGLNTADEVKRRLAAVGVQSAQGMLLTSLFGAGVNTLGDVHRVTAAAQSYERMKGLLEQVKESKLASRSPEKLEEAIGEVAKDSDVETVYTDVRVWNTLFQGENDADPREAWIAAGGAAEEYDQANERGADLKIPLERFVARLGPSGLAERLLFDSKTDPDGPTIRQAREILDRREQEIDELAKSGMEMPEQPADVAVYEDVRQKLLDAATPEADADKYARVWQSMFRALSSRTKRPADQLYGRYDLQVTREGIAPVARRPAAARAPAAPAETVRIAAVPAEATVITGTNAGQIEPAAAAPGRAATFAYNARGEKKPLEFRVVALDDLVTSHDDAGNPVPAYPAALQERDRSAVAARAQVEEIAGAGSFEALLTDQHSLDRGAPIVGADDRVVESGNGRTMALRLAREQNSPAWQEYQRAVGPHAAALGLTVEGVTDPVLVRVRAGELANLSEEDRVAFTRTGNVSGALSKRDEERARTDAEKITPDLLAKFPAATANGTEEILRTGAGAAWATEFLSSFDAAEMGSFVRRDGTGLTDAGIARVRLALRRRVFTGDMGDAVSASLEESDYFKGNLEKAIFFALPRLTQLVGAIERGERPESYDVRRGVVAALAFYARARKEEKDPADMARHENLFGHELAEDERQIVVDLSDALDSPARLGGYINGYVNAVLSLPPPSQGGLFEDIAPPDRLRLWTRTVAEIDQLEDERSAQRRAKRQAEAEARNPSLPDERALGQPVLLQTLRNRERSGDFGARFGQDVEPAGRYVVERDPAVAPPAGDRWETGTLLLYNPLEIDFGGGYQDPTNWKRVLSARYGGKTGVELSRALLADGYDGIITREDGQTREIVDLTVVGQPVQGGSIDVDGVARSTQRADGRPIHPTEEGVRAFWRWFGDSAAVDAQGRPLVVYHGRKLRHRREEARLLIRTGTRWSASDPQWAGRFIGGHRQADPASGRRKGGVLYPLFVRIQNPLRLEGRPLGEEITHRELARRAGIDPEAFANRLKELLAPRRAKIEADGFVVGDEFGFVSSIREFPYRGGERTAPLWAFFDNPETVQALRELGGYDGVTATENGGLIWGVFDETQAKSASGNTGAFDPAEPRIFGQALSQEQRDRFAAELRRLRRAKQRSVREILDEAGDQPVVTLIDQAGGRYIVHPATQADAPPGTYQATRFTPEGLAWGHYWFPSREAALLSLAGGGKELPLAYPGEYRVARGAEAEPTLAQTYAAAEQDPGRELDQSAFHGSPAKFERFDLSFLGSGEGAQAYGWGLYFAQRRDIAEHYRKSLSKIPVDPVWWMRGRFWTYDEVIAELKKTPPGTRRDPALFGLSIALLGDGGQSVLLHLDQLEREAERRVAYAGDVAREELEGIRAAKAEGAVYSHTPGRNWKVIAPGLAVWAFDLTPVENAALNLLTTLPLQAMRETGNDVQAEVRAYLREKLAELEHDAGRPSAGRDPHYVRSVETALEKTRTALEMIDRFDLRFIPPAEGGQLYKVEVPEDDELLVWDEELDRQPEWIREAFARLGVSHRGATYEIEEVADDLPPRRFRVWRTERGQRSLDRHFATREEAEQGVADLERYEATGQPPDWLVEEKARDLAADYMDKGIEDFEVFTPEARRDEGTGRWEAFVNNEDVGLWYDTEAEAMAVAQARADQAEAEQWDNLVGFMRDEARRNLEFDEPSFTGEDAYIVLSERLGSDEAASRALVDEGIPGHRFLDGPSRSRGGGTYNFVIYDDQRVQVSRTFYQSAPAEADPQLVVLHNLTASNLAHAEELGGLAAPSLAISRADAPLTGFGEITLVAGPELADPARTPVFDADVYSPRWPTVRHRLDLPAFYRLRDWLEPFAAETEDYLHDLQERLAEDGPKTILDHQRFRAALGLAWLRQKGREPRRPSLPFAPHHDVSTSPAVVAFFDAADLSDAGEAALKADPAPLEAAVRRGIDERLTRLPASAKKVLRETWLSDLFYFTEDGRQTLRPRRIAALIADYRKRGTSRVDYSAYRDEINLGIAQEGEEEFRAWAVAKLTPALGRPEIVRYTDQGRQVRTAYTLANVVRELTRKIRAGEGFNYGIGNARAMGAKRFRSLEAVKKARARVVPAAQMAAEKAKLERRFMELATALDSYYAHGGGLFGSMDAAAMAVGDSFKPGWTVKRALEANAFNDVPEDVRQQVAAFAGDLLVAPTEYFEAKPQRAVGLNEFRAAVVPSNVSAAALETLKRAGIEQVEVYDPAMPEARTAAVQRAAERARVLFQPEDGSEPPAPAPKPGKPVNLPGLSPAEKAAAAGRVPVTPVPPSQRKRGRINIAGRTFRIDLLEDADLSTFLHETGHALLEILRDLAAEGPVAGSPVEGQDALRADLQKVLDWLGIDDPAEIPDEAHERFARGLEHYFGEGRAPSTELAGVFEAFRRWILAIYRSLRGLNVDLTDEVRGVFDRLLATDEEIEAARMGELLRVKFEDARAAGATDAEYRAYVDAVERAKQGAHAEAARLVYNEVKREREAWWRAEWKTIAAEVTSELDADPAQRAYAILRNGVLPSGGPLPEGFPLLKLNSAELEKLLVARGAADAQPVQWTDQSMRKLAFLHEKTGGDPEVIAEMLGFESADAMVLALLARKPKRQTIKDETDRRMKERHGDVLNETALATLAADALHGERSAEVILAEQRFLARRVSKTPSVSDIVKAAARRSIGATPLRKIRPDEYRRAEVRARKAGREALIRGDLNAAWNETQRELQNFHLYREARRAVDEAKKIRDYFAKLTSPAGMKRIGKAGASYVQQIAALLERYELAQFPLDVLEGRASLRAFVAAEEAAGRTVQIPPAILDDARQVNWRDVPYDELAGVYDAVRSIEHLARTKAGLRLAREERDFETVKSAILHRLFTTHPPDSRFPLGDKDVSAVRRAARKLDAAHATLEELVLSIDGDDPNGPAAEVFVHPLRDAATRERELGQIAGKRVLEAVKALDSASRRSLARDRFYIRSIDQTLSMRQILAVALQMGNASNRQKLRLGFQVTRGGLIPWTQAAEDEILSHVTAAHWDLVQAIWKALDRDLWPEIEKLQAELTGIVPKKIEATPFDIVTADGKVVHLDGGYYPVVYDPRLAPPRIGESKNDLAQAFASGYVEWITPHGFTKERIEDFAYPIRLDPMVLPQHVAEVTHDIAFRVPVMNAWRVLTDPDVQAEMIRVMGEEYHTALKDRLKRTANARVYDSVLVNATYGWVLEHYRTAMTGASLAWNVAVFVQNVANLGPAIGSVGVRSYLKGWAEMLHDRGEAIRFVKESSGFMARRLTSFDANVAREFDAMFDGNGLVKGLDGARRLGLAIHGYSDLLHAYPAWLGAYRQARGEQKLSHEKAVRVADARVTDAFGDGDTWNLSHVQDAKLTRYITMFSSWFLNAVYRQQRRIFRQTRDRVRAGNYAGAAVWFAWKEFLNLAVPAILGDALMGKFRGDDDDEDSWLWPILSYLAGIPLMMRSIVNAFRNGNALSLPIFAPLDRSVKAGRELYDVAVEEEGSWGKAAADGAEALAYALGIPGTAQAKRTVRGLSGESDGPVDATVDTLLGPEPDARGNR